MITIYVDPELDELQVSVCDQAFFTVSGFDRASSWIAIGTKLAQYTGALEAAVKQAVSENTIQYRFSGQARISDSRELQRFTEYLRTNYRLELEAA